MSQTSTHLNLPYIQPAQAQKHVTHNEAVELLDMIVQLTVQDFDATTPTTSPTEGETWALGATPTGAWAGQAGMLATWRGGGWLFVTPQTGWRAYGVTPAQMRVYDGSVWASTDQALVLENLTGVGINATSDATNKLAVSSDATLLSHAGSGHQLKLNKAATANTASLLFQSNWLGRAEMGLTGNDDFSIKVSADGSTFTEALRINPASGRIAMPATGTQQLLPFNYRYYLYTDRSWISHSANGATLNAFSTLGTAAEPEVDWDAKGVFVPAGSKLVSFTLACSVSSPQVVDLDLRIYFQYGAWNTTWATDAATTRVLLHSANNAGVMGNGGMRRMTIPLGYTAPDDGYILLALRQHAGSVLSATEYLYTAGAATVILPPSG